MCDIDSIEARIGNDISESLQYYDQDLKSGVDLTNFRLRMGVKKSIDDATYLIDPLDIPITKMNQTTDKGWFYYLISKSQTSLLVVGEYYTDILLVDSAGLYDTIYSAIIHLRKKIT
jgi:hypothetical protein